MKEIYFLNGLKNLSGLSTIVNNKKKYIFANALKQT